MAVVAMHDGCLFFLFLMHEAIDRFMMSSRAEPAERHGHAMHWHSGLTWTETLATKALTDTLTHYEQV